MNEALKLVHKKLISVIAELANFADKYKNQPTLAFTHFQPAQPTTVGKDVYKRQDLRHASFSLTLLHQLRLLYGTDQWVYLRTQHLQQVHLQ